MRLVFRILRQASRYDDCVHHRGACRWFVRRTRHELLLCRRPGISSMSSASDPLSQLRIGSQLPGAGALMGVFLPRLGASLHKGEAPLSEAPQALTNSRAAPARQSQQRASHPSLTVPARQSLGPVHLPFDSLSAFAEPGWSSVISIDHGVRRECAQISRCGNVLIRRAA